MREKHRARVRVIGSGERAAGRRFHAKHREQTRRRLADLHAFRNAIALEHRRHLARDGRHPFERPLRAVAVFTTRRAPVARMMCSALTVSVTLPPFSTASLLAKSLTHTSNIGCRAAFSSSMSRSFPASRWTDLPFVSRYRSRALPGLLRRRRALPRRRKRNTERIFWSESPFRRSSAATRISRTCSGR